MYRRNDNFNKVYKPSQLSLSELNGLNISCMEELHLDTKSLNDHNLLVNSASSSVFSYAPSEESPNTTKVEVQSIHNNPFFLTETSINAKFTENALNMTTGHSFASTKNQNNHNNNKSNSITTTQTLHPIHKWKRQQFLNQHKSNVLNAEQRQTWNTVAANNTKEQDKISHSLKMFASLSAYNGGNDQILSQSRVDAAMQDFACNGYTSDKINRHQQQQYQGGINIVNVALDESSSAIYSSTANVNHNQWHLPQNQQNLNVDLNNIRNNFWQLFPTQIQQNSEMAAAATAAAAAVATATVNMNYSSSTKNYDGITTTTIKKTYKRNNARQEKYASVKHCVFCENNNEPEAVVKSHAVRDTFGRVLCPKLRTYICPICKISGDYAHTVKYCPKKPIITMEDAIKAESLRLTKNIYKQTKL